MKRKKHILLIDRDAERQSLTRFVLKCHGFKVISANSLRSVNNDKSLRRDLHLVLAFDYQSDNQVAEIAAYCYCNALIIRRHMRSTPQWVRTLYNPSMIELMEAIHIYARRKRGPKIGMYAKRKPIQSTSRFSSRAAA